MVNVKNLSVSYGEKSVFNSVDLEINQGSISGLMGRNGAGKTSLIKAIIGEIPYRGDVCYDPILLDGKKRLSKQNLFFVSDSPFYYDYLTAVEFAQFTIHIKTGKSLPLEQIFKVFDFFGIEESDSLQFMKDYSFGMRRKVVLSIGFILKPRLLILDEPTIGLDVPSVIALKKLLKEYVKMGNSVLVSSHDPLLIKELCQTLLILNDQKSVYYNKDFQEEERDLSALYLDLVGENLTKKIEDFFAHGEF